MKSKWAFRKADRDSIVLLIIVIVASVVLFPFLADKKDRKDSVPLSLCVEYDKKRTYLARYVRVGMGKIA